MGGGSFCSISTTYFPDSLSSSHSQTPAFLLSCCCSLFRSSLPQISVWLISLFLSDFSSSVSFNRPLIILPLPCFVFSHHTYLCIYLLVCSLCVSPSSLRKNRTLFCSVWYPLCLEQNLSCSSHSNIVEWLYELLTFYASKEKYALCD